VRSRRLVHPLLFVTLIALFLLSARIMAAQTAGAAPPPTRRVAVATRMIPRGTVLSASDFAVRDTAVRTVSALPDSTRVSAGWVARRSIAAGELLVEPAVEAPAVVSANGPVEVEWKDQNVTLTVRGIATRNAAIGERVPVRTTTGHRIEATVVAPGRVRME
jgi:flagella basal body P-ring formation protein FlgA